jgi:hypothetical protein
MFFLWRQTCKAFTVPETFVTYPAAEAFCESNSREATVTQATQLSVYCKVINDFFWSDQYFECGSIDNAWALQDEFAASGFRYTCTSNATFPAGSTTNESQVIPETVITTDPSWVNNPDGTCFKLSKAGATARPSVSPVAQSASLSPATLAPIVTPTVRPTTDLPTSAPIANTVDVSGVQGNQGPRLTSSTTGVAGNSFIDMMGCFLAALFLVLD